MRKITLLTAALAISLVAMAQAMSGTYKVGVTDPVSDFTTLKAAIDAVNANGVAGDVLLEITSNLTEAADISLGVNTGLFKITIKPAATTNPVITFTNIGTSVSIDGHFIIGSPNALNTNLIPTNNLIIDGSNTIDGSTKDLTFIGSASSVTRSVFRVFGNCDGITIKNCIITTKNTSGSSNACIQLTDYTTFAPDNFTALNNTLNANSGNGSLGALISVSGTPTALMTGIKIQNNVVTSRATRAIMFNYVADGEISGNTITHDLQLSTGAAQTIAVLTGGAAAGTFNIFNNIIKQVKTWNTAAGPAASNGAIGIDNQLAAPKIVNIYNNFITGFTIANASVQGVKIYGIRHIGGSTSNIYHNTIVIPEMTDMTTTTGSFIAAIAFATGAVTEASPTGTMNVKNNIIVSNESAMKVWGIRRVGTGGTFTSDNNVIFATTSNNWIGFYNGTDIFDWALWRTASGQDANSKSVDVNFTNAATGDLSLTGASIGDWQLAVPKQATVLTDIDGSTRADLTYVGADEATTDLTTVAKQFKVTVPKGTSKVYVAGSFTGKNWEITDPFALKATGSANEFGAILPCVDGVEYKYLCEKGDWDYQEAVFDGSNPPLEGSNRSYSANDNVPIWFRVNKITLNATFATAVPNTLFVKGSFDAWAAGHEMTKNGSTYSIVIGGNAGDKYPANTEYKYYTNDMNADNWESNSDGSNRDNRWAIAPVMDDEIARFVTAIPGTGVDEIQVTARIMRTVSGIEVVLDGEANIELYSINGALLDKTVANSNYSKALNSGIYIIRVNGVSTKFVK